MEHEQSAQTPTVEVNLALSNRNRLLVSCSELGEGCAYIFSLFRGEELMGKLDSTEENVGIFWLTEPGKYHVKAVVIDRNENRLVSYSSSIEYVGMPIVLEEPKKKENPLQSVWFVLKEIWQNRERMFRIAVYDYRTRDKDSYLGKLWSILNPLIQILTFWFVFGLGLRGGRPVDGHPFLLWMLCGLLPWFFVNAGIVGGSASLYTKAGLVLRMQYPLATITLGNILVSFFDHAVTMLIVLVVEFFYGYSLHAYWLNILYYWIYSIVFLSALALVTSTLTMIARDFQKLIASLIRLLFYMTPILWTLDSMPEWAQGILKLNPALYIIDGYRESLLYGVNFWVHTAKIPFFWTLNLTLLLLGSYFHRKLRDRFIDML